VQEVDEDELTDEDVGLSVVNVDTVGDGHGVRPGIVHRLDKDTSGLLVVARNDVAHARLAEQFAARSIHRRYEAVVWGVPARRSGRIESYLGRDPRDRRRMTTVSEATGKYAATNYAVIESLGNTAILEFRLETGRTHQIRVHAREMGHPVFGDPVYGGNRILRGARNGARKQFFDRLLSELSRQALHASELGFVHPATGQLLRFKAPLPPDMVHVVQELRRHDAI
jgi:23S rRNA pseudouridine1911/1915/1917 synthase